jgi:hypothetical protein
MSRMIFFSSYLADFSYFRLKIVPAFVKPFPTINVCFVLPFISVVPPNILVISDPKKNRDIRSRECGSTVEISNQIWLFGFLSPKNILSYLALQSFERT